VVRGGGRTGPGEGLAREREPECEQWAREDDARAFEHRREAYLDFYVAVKALARMPYGHGYGFTEAELPDDRHEDADAKLRSWSLTKCRHTSESHASSRPGGTCGGYGWPPHVRNVP
jgi:hypothetical protein